MHNLIINGTDPETIDSYLKSDAGQKAIERVLAPASETKKMGGPFSLLKERLSESVPLKQIRKYLSLPLL